MQRIEKLLNAFVEASQKILEDNLVGIYLHGSASMGCFVMKSPRNLSLWSRYFMHLRRC